MTRRRLSGGFASLLCLSTALIPVAALAEDAPPTTDIIVTATGQSTATSTTKTDTPIIESPQSISIVNREEMDLRATPTIADALSYTAGVLAEPVGIDSRTDEVSVRGFGAGGFSSNNNFVDGLRLPAGGQWTRFGFDTFGLQQIDVLKGPSGALYGQTAPGGVVNIVTKRPTDTFQAQFMLQGIGTTELNHWNFQAAADISGPITSNLSGRLVGMNRYGDTQVDTVENGRKYLSPSLTWKPGENTTWTVLGQYQRDEGGSTYQFLPELGTLNPTNGGFLPNDAYVGEPDWNTFDRSQYLAASFFEHRFSDAITFRNNTRYTHAETLYRVTVLSGNTVTNCASFAAFAVYAGCINGQTIGRRAVQGTGETDGWATDNQIQGKFATGPVEHTVLAGFDYFHTKWEHYRDLVTMPGVPRGQVEPLLDIFNPVPRGSSRYTSLLQPQIYTEAKSEQSGIYLQDQIEWGGLRVTVGGRQDWADDYQYNPVADTSFRVKSDAFTWRAGAVYLFENGLAPYASYAESFQPQVNDPTETLGGQAFVPTTGQQYEAGVRFQRGDNIYVTLGGYQITQQNVVTPATLADLPAGSTQADLDALACAPGCSVQTGEIRIRGLELEGKATLPWGMALIATATRTKSKVTETNTPGQLGNRVSQVPNWMASAFVNQSFNVGESGKVGLGGGVRYVGETYGDIANTLAIPDYTLFDLFVRYEFGNGIVASVNGRNIADKRYVASCGSVAACYYGQGRSVTARLDFRW